MLEDVRDVIHRFRVFLAELARFPPRTKEREGAMLAQRCMGWHLTTMGKSHLNSLTNMSNAFPSTQRKTMEEANEQMFKGYPWVAQRLRSGVVFLQGHDGEFTFMVKHGLLMGTSEAPRKFSWSFDKTFKRWKLNHQTPPIMMLAAPLVGMRGTKVDRSWSGCADDLFIKELPDHTADSAKDVILNNAASLDNTLAEDRYKQNLREQENCAEHPPMWRAKTAHITGPVWKGSR